MARYPFATVLDRLAVSATVEEIALPPMSSRSLRSCDVIMGLNVTHATTTIEIGVKQGNTYIPLKRAASAAANISVGLETKIWLTGEWRPYVRFYGATAVDALSASFVGYVDDKIEE